MASDNCDCDRFSMLKGFRSSCFRAKISPRAYRRGIQFAMEGYLSNVLVEEDSGGFLLTASCFASYEKKRKRKVSVRLGRRPEFALRSSSCECTAGEGDCSHAAGLLHYLASVALYSEYENEEIENDSPPTSKARSWGLPPVKRRIEPLCTLEEVNFKRVKEGEAFISTVAAPDPNRDHRPLSLRQVNKERYETLCNDLQNANPDMIMLRYHKKNRPFTESGKPSKRFLCSPFATTSLRLPERFLPLWVQQSEFSGVPSREDVSRWKAKFLLLLGSVDRDAVEQQTAAQASCDMWFLERVCRLTASKIKSVVTRRRDHHNLVQSLLYKEPPTHLPALH